MHDARRFAVSIADVVTDHAVAAWASLLVLAILALAALADALVILLPRATWWLLLIVLSAGAVAGVACLAVVALAIRRIRRRLGELADHERMRVEVTAELVSEDWVTDSEGDRLWGAHYGYRVGRRLLDYERRGLGVGIRRAWPATIALRVDPDRPTDVRLVYPRTLAGLAERAIPVLPLLYLIFFLLTWADALRTPLDWLARETGINSFWAVVIVGFAITPVQYVLSRIAARERGQG